MNKKIISIILIFSLLAVGLTCISATNDSTNNVVSENSEVTDAQSNAVNTETKNQEKTSTTNDTINETNTTDNNTEINSSDVVVPTKKEDLQKFEILMNFITPEGKEYFANQLSEIDSNSYKDVIAALKNNDMEHLFYYLGQLDQNKIDTFFTTFLKLFDYTQTNPDNSNTQNSNSNVVTDTISNILGTSQSQKTVGTQFIKTNPKLGDSNKKSSQQYPMYIFKGKQYSLIDFITALKNAYENGEITYDDLIKVLEDNGIDTSDIKNEDGVVKWGFLYMIPQSSDTTPTEVNTTSNDTNSTTQTENSDSSINDDFSPSSNSNDESNKEAGSINSTN